jgi:hypothetical protein
MKLRLLPGTYAVSRLGPGAPAPAGPRGEGFWSLTAIGEERSLVCLQEHAPVANGDGTTVVPGWRILEVAGPLDLGMIGVLAALASALSEASVPIFPIATHDTDWILVPGALLPAALEALRAAEHEVLHTS